MISYFYFLMLKCFNLYTLQRSFCATHKIFRKGGAQGFAFWSEFKEFFSIVKEDQMEDKWDKLMEKEEKRIKKYVD